VRYEQLRWTDPATAKIHLAVDTRCRPISRITTAGHRHDSLAFTPVMAGIRIRRRGPGRPRTRPGWMLADRAYNCRDHEDDAAGNRHGSARCSVPELVEPGGRA
jgi:hypothetical protein